jgi:hypothetical protein
MRVHEHYAIVSDCSSVRFTLRHSRVSRQARRSRWQVLHECDLALLTCMEDNSFEEITPMELSEPDILPSLREKVHVLGFPVGGDEVSITEGVVSRVEVQVRAYHHYASSAVGVPIGRAEQRVATRELVGLGCEGRIYSLLRVHSK